MKALQYTGPKALSFTDVPYPQIGDNDVLLKTKKVGICGTDLHIYSGGMDLPTPLIPGHEFVGEVAQVGKNVTGIEVGDMAVGEHVVGCGQCVYCKEAKMNLCVKPQVIGIGLPGALAEYVAIPAHLVHVLPKELDTDAGVLVEPLSIAVYAVRKVDVNIGDIVAVVGQGPIGLFLDQILTAAGGTVIGLDIMDARLAFATEHGYIDTAINTKNEDPIETCKKHTNGYGVDVTFEAVGMEPTVNTAISITRSGGKVGLLGVFSKPTTVDMMQVVKRELQVIGSWTCIFAFEPTIQLLKTGKIKTEGLITHRYKFEDAIKAFEDSANYTDNRIKTVIEFD